MPSLRSLLECYCRCFQEWDWEKNVSLIPAFQQGRRSASLAVIHFSATPEHSVKTAADWEVVDPSVCCFLSFHILPDPREPGVCRGDMPKTCSRRLTWQEHTYRHRVPHIHTPGSLGLAWSFTGWMLRRYFLVLPLTKFLADEDNMSCKTKLQVWYPRHPNVVPAAFVHQ